MNRHEQAAHLHAQGLNATQIAGLLGVKERTAERLLRKRSKNRSKRKGPVVGVIGDTHIPFVHPNYLAFIKETFESRGVTEVVHIGDLVDHHAISRHERELDAEGAKDEYLRTKRMVCEWTEAFPEVKMCNGNHDNIPARQIKQLDLPTVWLKSFAEAYNLPDTWELADHHVMNGVCYKHGIGASGKDGAYNSMTKQRLSVVQGHQHSFAGIKYHSNDVSLCFGMNVGCGIDISAHAFAYGKFSENRPVLGCGVVYSASHAEFIPMDMNKWSKHNES